MSDPDYCYKCGEIVTFCECDKSITKPWDALEHFRDRCGELEAELSELREAMLPLIAGYGYCSFLDDKERLDDPDIKRAMAALLNGEQEAPRIKTTWQADWERGKGYSK